MRKKIFNGRNEDYTYIVSKEQPLSFTAENLQKLILNIEYANMDNDYKVIQFTSTLGSEGKTTIISNVAYLLAQKNKKVIVVDLDLRKPKIHRVFQRPNEKGLNDYLLNEVSLEDAIKKSNCKTIDFINSGRTADVITNALTSTKLKELINNLKEKYDYVLVDSPPTLLVSDALYIAKVVDGIVYVVGYDKARKRDVKSSLREIQKGSTKIIGAVISQVKMRKRDYYYYDYK